MARVAVALVVVLEDEEEVIINAADVIILYSFKILENLYVDIFQSDLFIAL